MKLNKFIVIVIFFMLISCSVIYAGSTSTPRVAADAAILMDHNTGRVLWGKNIDKPKAMASTTKIMTCIIALESGKADEVLTVSRRASRAPKVKLYLREGEKQRVEDMLYALMMVSANDAAVAIAEHVGGSVEEFCQMMTDKAKEIGCTDTIFETPNGLDKGKHHSTAKDMALITSYALKNEKFMKIINTRNITTPIKGGNYRRFSLRNHNRLLNEFQGANGFKTGFTNLAGHCFVGGAKRNGMQLISVVLASGWGARGKQAKWTDTKKILSYGFANYKYSKILNKNEIISEDIKIANSKGKDIDLYNKDDIVVAIRENEKDNIKFKTYYPDELVAPIEKGMEIGRVDVCIDDEVVYSTDLLSNKSVEESTFKRWFGIIAKDFFKQVK